MKTKTRTPRPRILLWALLLAVALAGPVVHFADNGAPPAAAQDPADEHAELIARIYEWRNDPQWSHQKEHTDRWDRALLAFGETVSDSSLTALTAAEAQAFADRGWGRWVEVAEALRAIEAARELELELEDDGEQGPVSRAELPDQSVPEGAPGQGVQPTQISAITLVSNLGQTLRGHVGTGTGTAAKAMSFTTGSNAGGYTLASIEAVIGQAVADGDRTKVAVELWSATSTGAPDAKLASLTLPSSLAAGSVSFAAPANTTLSANTTYFFVYWSEDATNLALQNTREGNEDAGAAEGWSIGATSRYSSANGDPSGDPNDDTLNAHTWSDGECGYYGCFAVKMAVNGTANPAVSNLGQAASGFFGTNGSVRAQGFTVGSHASGYNLSSIELFMQAAVSSANAAKLRVELWSESSSSGGGPGSMEASLTVPSGALSAGAVSFAAPAGTTLSTGETYFVVAYTTDTTSIPIAATTNDGEDDGAAAGWSIADELHIQSRQEPLDTASWTTHSKELRVRVYASEALEALPTVELSSSAASAAEADTEETLTITATLSEAATPAAGVTVTLAKSGTATANTDYTLADTITVAQGATTGTATLTVKQDSAVEADETVLLDGSASDHTSGPQLTVTIDDDDTPAAPTLTVTAGDGELGLSWTVPAGVLTGYEVQYRQGTSGSWTDVAHSGTGTTATVDGLTNGSSYQVRVRAVSAAGGGAWAQKTATPVAATLPTVTLSSSAASAAEADTEETLTITATLSEAATPAAGVTVTLTKKGTATANTDYTLADTITVAQGATTGEATLTVKQDGAVEADETVLLDGSASGHTSGPQLTVTIDDDDTPAKPTALMVAERDTELGLSWTAPAGVLTGYDVHYTSASKMGDTPVADDAALQTGQNPSAASGWVDAGHTGTTASHSISGLTNDDEYRVRIRATSAAGDGAWEFTTGTPAMPELPAVGLSITPGTVGEAADNRSKTITVTLKEAAGTGGVEVTLTRKSTSTAATTDYGLVGSITVAEGETKGTAVLAISDDKVDEDTETLILEATAEGHSVGTLELMIVDNDTAGVVIGDGTTITRTVEARDTATYTIKLASQPTADVKVTPTSSDTNKATVSGELTFTTSNWNQAQTVTITGVAAGTDLKITHAVTGVTSSSDPKYPASLTIADVGLTVRVSTKTYEITATRTAAEGASASLTVTLGRAAPTGGLAFTASYDYSGSTATSADTGTTPSTVTVSAGATTAMLSVPIAQDALVEGAETFTVTISTSVTGWQAKSAGKDASTITISETENAKIAFGSNAESTARFEIGWFEDLGTLSVPVTVSHLPGESTVFEVEVVTPATPTLGDATQCSTTPMAVAGDFCIATKSVTFGPSDTSKTQNVKVSMVADDLVEVPQGFVLRIKAARAQDHMDYDLGDLYARDAAGDPADDTDGASSEALIDIGDATSAYAAFHASNPQADSRYTASAAENVSGGKLRVPVVISNRPEADIAFTVTVGTGGTATQCSTTPTVAAGDFCNVTKSVMFTKSSTPVTVNRGGQDFTVYLEYVEVDIEDDALVENDQTIELFITEPRMGEPGAGDYLSYTNNKLYIFESSVADEATLTITDDDRGGAKVAFGAAADSTAKLTTPSAEEDVMGGTLNVPITVSALPDTDTTFTVDVLTGNAAGTATEWASAQAPGDFRIVTKSVTFGPDDSSTTKNLAITLNDDDLVENDQTIELRLAAVAASPGTVGAYGDLGDYYARDAMGKLAQATIEDDDRGDAKIAFGNSAAATVTLTPDVDEEVSGGELNVPVTISHLPEEDTTFTVRVLTTGMATEYSDSATPGRDDFRIAEKELEFTSTSARTGNIVITINDDDVVENDQTVQLEIVAADNPADDLGDHYARHAMGKLATVTIEDDDRDEAKIALDFDATGTDKLVAEGAEDAGNFVVPVTISHRPQEGITFTLEVTGGTARETGEASNPTGNPKDYVIAEKTVTWAAVPGSLDTLFVTVNIEDDRVEEDTETIEVRIRPAAASPGTPGAYGDLGDYYTRHAQSSTGTLTITDNDEVAKVTLSVNRDANDLDEITVLEGTSVTVTATADIPVGPRGWTVASENTWLTHPTYLSTLPITCNEGAGQWPGLACPNDYTLPAAFTIEEGQTQATATLRLTSDSRTENTAERLGLKATATRTTEGGAERSLTTNELDLHINENRAGINLSTGSFDLVPAEVVTYTVVLRGNQPSASVTVTPTSGDTDKATVSCAADPCVLTFTADNWDQPQEVTVTAVAVGTATISHASSSSDTNYNGLSQLGQVAVTVKAAVQTYRVTQTAGGPEGGTAELTLNLGALAPDGGLAFTVSRARLHSETTFNGNPLPAGAKDRTAEPSQDLGSGRVTTLTIPAGKRVATISDPLRDDDVVEQDEHYYLEVSTSVSGWAASTVHADCGPSSAGAGARYTAEVSEAAGTLQVPVTISANPWRDATFTVEVLSTGSATEGSDYSIASKTLTFTPGGAATRNLAITLTNDAAIEPDETIVLRIAAPTGNAGDVAADLYERGNASQATITLSSDDGGVEVSGSSVSVSTGATASYTVRLTGAQPAGTVSIAVASSATDKATVSPASLDFTTANWNQPQTVRVTGVADGTATITHSVSATQPGYPPMGHLSAADVSVAVTALPTVSLAVSPNPVREGLAVTVTLTLSEAIGTVKTIPIVLTEVTADAGDYGTLANIPITASGTSFTGTITTHQDDDTEDETFTVALGALPSSVARGTAHTLTVTISDDDENGVSLSASPNPVDEGDTVTITATLDQPLSSEVVIPLTITNGTAEDEDRGTLAEITIAAGERSGSGEIETRQDDGENDETFSVALGALPPEVVAGTDRSVTVTIRDDDGAPPPTRDRPTTGGGPGGGGGGGGGGPSPSEADFEWTVKHDIEALASGHDRPAGSWSDGETLWVLENGTGADDAVYAYDLETGERVEEREFALDERNRAPRGVASDGETAWVSDSGRDRLYAYDLASGERLPGRDLELDARNRDARGIWSGGGVMWVLDGGKDAIFAYDPETGALLGEYALDARNADPRGLWSDGVTVWVSDHGAKQLFAYRLPVLPEEEETAEPGAVEAQQTRAPERPALERVTEEEFTELSKASNNSPRGIWSDGVLMYVADEADGKVYTYNMPDAIDARLASLALEGVVIGVFDPLRTEYAGVPGEGVTATVVTAGAAQRRTEIAIDPPDADERAPGHQVALEGLAAITVTVTSADGSRTRVYRVVLDEGDPEPWAHCLKGALAAGFSLVVFEGGSVEELAACAESRGVRALYALHEGRYEAYIPEAPDFVNEAFAARYPEGVPALTPLVAASEGPASEDPVGELAALDGWPGCLRGELVEDGFSLVLYEGGTVEELAACADEHAVTAAWALHEGEWVSYIPGAPEFVNRAFGGLFAGGVPPLTPLVVRSPPLREGS